MTGCMPAAGLTRKPLMVCGSVKLRNIASTIAGRLCGRGRHLLHQVLEGPDPAAGSAAGALKLVRMGSSTTLTSRIISSWR